MNLAIRSIAGNLADRVHRDLSDEEIGEITRTYHA